MTDMHDLMSRATREVVVPTEAILARASRRGRTLRRRRRVLLGAGSVAAVAVVGAGAVVVGQSITGSAPVAVPAGPAGPAAPAIGSTSPIPPKALAGTHTMYTGETDAPLALDADQIHARLASMLPAGEVGPILTQQPYPKVSEGTDRIEHFTYDGSLVSFIISAAKGSETCESFAANADPDAGFACVHGGEVPVLTEETAGAFGLNSATAWSHGYQVTLMSYAAGPSGQANPAMDGKKMEHVAAQPPLSLDVLTQVATSDAWFG